MTEADADKGLSFNTANEPSGGPHFVILLGLKRRTSAQVKCLCYCIYSVYTVALKNINIMHIICANHLLWRQINLAQRCAK